MKRILIAPDSFKNSISSIELCQTLEGLLQDHRIVSLPLADGGEHSLDTLEKGMKALKRIYLNSEDPLGRSIASYYLLDAKNKTAYIELANSCGIEKIKVEERNPMNTSTAGTGLQMAHAIKNDIRQMVLFIGSSCTNDFGTGILQNLGFEFYDDQGTLLKTKGSELKKIHTIKAKNLPDIKIKVACDVDNLLVGEKGAAKVYGPQKGATDTDIEELELAAFNFARLVQTYARKDILKLKGGGAAGGIGAGLYGLLNAELVSGFDLLSDVLNLERHIYDSDLVITGEGSLDRQSLDGKTIGKMAALCLKYQKPLMVICGINKLDQMTFRSAGIEKVIDLSSMFGSKDISSKTTVKNITSIETMLKKTVSILLDA